MVSCASMINGKRVRIDTGSFAEVICDLSLQVTHGHDLYGLRRQVGDIGLVDARDVARVEVGDGGRVQGRHLLGGQPGSRI